MRYYQISVHRFLRLPKKFTIAVDGDIKKLNDLLQEAMNGNSLAFVDINNEAHIVDRNSIEYMDVIEVELKEDNYSTDYDY